MSPDTNGKTHLNGRNGQFPELVADIGSAGQLQASAAPSSPLGQKVSAALREALAWRPRAIDPRGFVAALNSSFEITEKEGHTEWRWTPRSYAVQADMGAVTGAQASIYSRAKAALDHSEPLIEGLKSLKSDTDEDEAEAIRSLVIAEMKELVDELGLVGGYRQPRVAGLFHTLLGSSPFSDPQKVGGLLGKLRDQLGLIPDRVNTVAEEQNLTNFLIVVDHFRMLSKSWESLPGMAASGQQDVFFGTQLVRLSRHLGVLVETVYQVYHIMDAVFIGQAERQTIPLLLKLQLNTEPKHDTELTIFALLSWVERFAQEEAPHIIEEASKDGVISFRQTMHTLSLLVDQALVLALEPGDENRTDIDDDVAAILRELNPDLPANYRHVGVRKSLDELAAHLRATRDLVESFKRMPDPEVRTIIPSSAERVADVRLYVAGRYFPHNLDVYLVSAAQEHLYSAVSAMRLLSQDKDSNFTRSNGQSPKRRSRLFSSSIPIMGEVIRLSDTQLDVTFDLSNTPAGRYYLVVRDSSTGDSGSGEFVVVDAQIIPEQVRVDALVPNFGAQGDLDLPVEVYGQSLEEGNILYLGKGIGTTPLKRNDLEILVTTISISDQAQMGSHTAQIYDSDGHLRTAGPANFDVRSANLAPVVNEIYPPSGKPGSSIPITIIGENFENPLTVLLAPEISVSNARAMYPNVIKAEITIGSGVTEGACDVTVIIHTTNAHGTKPKGFYVEGSSSSEVLTPAINEVQPLSGDAGTILKNVKILGDNFQRGAGVSFGSNIKIEGVEVLSDTEIQIDELNLTKATVGSIKVRVNNPGQGGVAEARVFEVTPRQSSKK